MSDYFGKPILEDWLAEEVFHIEVVPQNIVSLFERWRECIETDITNWMESDDGYGNCLSWRGWGRGFSSIPDEDFDKFDSTLKSSNKILSANRKKQS